MVAFLESPTDSYAILQLREDVDDNIPLMFANYSYLQKKEMEPEIDRYEVVYHGSISMSEDVNAEAKKRKLQVEYEQESGTFIPPSAKTVNDLLDEYMSIYGVNTWAMSTYESRKSLIANYIRPLIGDMKLEDVTPRIMDKYYRDFQAFLSIRCHFPMSYRVYS